MHVPKLDVVAPKAVWHILLYDSLHCLLQFRRGGIVNTAEEDHLHLFNQQVTTMFGKEPLPDFQKVNSFTQAEFSD